jgi:hypothetical protein
MKNTPFHCEECVEGLQADGETPCPCQWDDLPMRVRNLKRDLQERDAKLGHAMRHLGNVLQLLAELHTDDRCKALDSALAFYNAHNPTAIIDPVEGYESRLVIRHIGMIG